MTRRRRALLLGGLALVLGGLAAFDVAGREAALERSIGGLVDVVVAREPIAAGALLRQRELAIRRVPRRFVPAAAVASPRALTGLRAAVDIAAGTDLTAALVGDPRQPRAGPPIGRGERVVEVAALGSPELVTAGARVDVLVTPEPGSGGDAGGETLLALEDLEVLSAAPAGDGGGASADRAAPGSRVLVALRVSLRQALYLAAAQDFARELRVLPRAPGDRARGRAGLRAGANAP